MSHRPEDACRQYQPNLARKGNPWHVGQVWCCPDCNRLWYVTQTATSIYSVQYVWQLVKKGK